MKKSARIAVLFVLALIGFQATAATVLITGSNRGIGLELARQYTEAGWEVIATCRTPSRADALNAMAAKHDNLSVMELDVTDAGEIAALKAALGDKPIDVLLHNAGILGDIEQQAFGNVDYDTYAQVQAVNVFAPIALSEALVDNVAASEQKKIVGMTSGLGSMTFTARAGRFYAYRISKAGLNMAMRAMRADLKPRGIAVGLVAPGMVDTELLWASGYKGPALSVEESVDGLMKIIDAVSLEDDGLAVNYDGQAMPW